jgi:6-phosphogluconolactonase
MTTVTFPRGAGRWCVAALLAGLAVLSALPMAASAQGPTSNNDAFTVYIGTYTGQKSTSKGIYAFRFDAARGTLTPVGLVSESDNPSFLALHPSGRFVYAVNEVGEFAQQKSGAVSAFRRDPASGRLTLINQRASKGGAPCHIVVDRSGRYVLVANYSGGNVAVLPIGEDGSLGEAVSVIQHEGSGPNASRQKGPHAHSINLDATNRFAVAADLGIDKLLVYRFDAGKGTLAPNAPPAASTEPGAGPRHFAFTPDNRFALAINELNSTLTSFAWKPDTGVLSTVESVSTLPTRPADAPPSYTAEVQVHPSGRFAYGSNRGHDSIAVFALDGRTGRLTPVEHESTRGKRPRNFGIDPTGRWLIVANQETDSLAVFRIDQQTGALDPVGDPVTVGTPVCVKFVK